MYLPWKEIDRRASCFLALRLKPQFPLSRVEKIKAFLLGRVFKLGNRH
jgi:hypothetical protein